jgi:hypothetical protein
LAWWLTPSVSDVGGTGPANPHAGLELAGLLGRYWWLKGRVHEGLGWLEPAIRAAPDAPAADLARALSWTGVLLDVARRSAEAADRLEQALTLLRMLGDDAGIARTLNSLGVSPAPWATSIVPRRSSPRASSASERLATSRASRSPSATSA